MVVGVGVGVWGGGSGHTIKGLAWFDLWCAASQELMLVWLF